MQNHIPSLKTGISMILSIQLRGKREFTFQGEVKERIT